MSEKRKISMVPAKMSALAANTSIDLVKKVRAGKRLKGSKAQKVLRADNMLEDGMTALLTHVNNSINS